MERVLSFPFRSICLLSLSFALLGCSQAETHPNIEATDAHSDAHVHTKTAEHSGHSERSVTKASHVRSAESHIHGGASLSIVSEGDAITIEFETPLYNLLGFEYAPQTRNEKLRVSETEDILSKPQNLIKFNAEAKCSFKGPLSHIDLFHNDHDEEDHHDDEHHDHEDAKHHEENSKAKHTDVTLSYALKCQSIEKLKTVKVEFFNVFSNFAQLELVYLGPNQQMSADLSSSRPMADLTR